MPEITRKEKEGVIICLILQSLSWMAIPIAFIRVSGKRRNAGSGPACDDISGSLSQSWELLPAH